jgi:hypothetical protein
MKITNIELINKLNKLGFNSEYNIHEVIRFFRTKELSFSVDYSCLGEWEFYIVDNKTGYSFYSPEVSDPDLCEYLMIEYLTEYLEKITDPNYNWAETLTEEQKESIQRGLDDLKEGRVVSHEEVMKQEKEEYIICSAIWYKELELKRPEVLEPRGFRPYNVHVGIVFGGFRHMNCMYQMVAITGLRDCEAGESIQGFLTSKNRFVDRKEAAKIAIEQNQIIKDRINENMLFSEDIY